MIFNVRDLSDEALDWAVAMALDRPYRSPDDGDDRPAFSSDPAQGLPVMMDFPCEHHVGIGPDKNGLIRAVLSGFNGRTPFVTRAQAPIVAEVLRCLVWTKFGDQIEVPEDFRQVERQVERQSERQYERA